MWNMNLGFYEVYIYVMHENPNSKINVNQESGVFMQVCEGEHEHSL